MTNCYNIVDASLKRWNNQHWAITVGTKQLGTYVHTFVIMRTDIFVLRSHACVFCIPCRSTMTYVEYQE